MPKTRTLPLIMMVSAILAALASCADYSYTPPDTTGASGTVETGIHLQIPPVSGTTTSEYPVTIMCWNVLNFEKADAYAKIAAEISNHRVDILILCEVQNNDDDEARFTAALNAVGWSMPYHSLTRMSDNYNSLGIFSRYPITTATEILESDGPRSILKAVVVLTNDKTITLYGGHLKSGTTTYAYAQRKNQSLALANYVRANHPMLTNDYIAILGDMNTMGSATGDPEIGRASCRERV